MKITIGISPCPNDTYVFHSLIHKKISSRGLDLSFEFLDIEKLNERALHGNLAIAKVSMATANTVKDKYSLLPVGAALGFGVGPIVVGRSPAAQIDPHAMILCPGLNTTATMLFRHFYPECKLIQHQIFSGIFESVKNGIQDFGVVIHEGRFTYQTYGLSLIADLGALWENTYRSPLPLGGLVAQCSLAPTLLQTICELVKESILYSHSHPQEVLKTMKQYAQELDESALWKHVELYVNEQTFGIDTVGRRAIATFMEICHQTQPALGK